MNATGLLVPLMFLFYGGFIVFVILYSMFEAIKERLPEPQPRPKIASSEATTVRKPRGMTAEEREAVSYQRSLRRSEYTDADWAEDMDARGIRY